MTIKDFACLCGCNPQTLRYYDHVNLLKPAKVDKGSGYRYYKKEQALTFVKIRHLQDAGFTIAEIKELLDADNAVIIAAFDRKSAVQEDRLKRIKAIQRSYQNEMSQMTQKLTDLKETIIQAMLSFDPEEEFGIDKAQRDGILGSIDQFFDKMIADDDCHPDYWVASDKANKTAFANMALALLIGKNHEKQKENSQCLQCLVTDSEDRENHFWLLKGK